MQYQNFLYLYPPRSTTSIEPGSFHYENMKKRKNWYAQLKLNGQRNVVYISPEKEVQFWNRHRSLHKNWDCPKWLLDLVKQLGGNGWTVLDGELLHAKDSKIKNTLYFWDILVYNNKYLVGEKYSDRYNILKQLLGADDNDDIYRAHDNIWMAGMISPNNYDYMWRRTEESWVEGFVFKNVDAKLRPCIAEKNNYDWQVRCRKKHKAYLF